MKNKTILYCFLFFVISQFYLSCKKSDVMVEEKTDDKVVTKLPAIQKCFLFELNKDTTTVSYSIDENNAVLGKMHYNPYQKDGAIGSFSGLIANDTIIVDYNYIIEGNQQSEEKIFVVNGNKLLELGGPLQDVNGKMIIKNKKTATIRTTLNAIDCSKINFPE